MPTRHVYEIGRNLLQLDYDLVNDYSSTEMIVKYGMGTMAMKEEMNEFCEHRAILRDENRVKGKRW